MSRDIKFRAFVSAEYIGEESGLMVTDKDVDFRLVGSASGFSLLDGGDNWVPDEHFMIMQYTGLHDCNGVEVYESDVVKVAAAANGERSFEYLGAVIFEGFEYCVEATASRWPLISWKCVEKCEVIGNIHEHPELLRRDLQASQG